MSPEPRDDVDPETWRDRLFDGVRDHSGTPHHAVASPPAEGGSRDVGDDVETPVDPDELVAELEAETELRTDGGRPAPLEDAHDRALQILENPGEHLPDDVKEELEELGIDPDDLDPSLGGVRGGLWREDVPAVVATILQRYDVPLEITARLSDDRYHWEVEWVRDEVVDYTEREDLEYVPGGDLR